MRQVMLHYFVVSISPGIAFERGRGCGLDLGCSLSRAGVVTALILLILIGPAVAARSPGGGANPVEYGPMSETQIRAELIGPPMRGSYADGQPWDETYFPGGRISYKDSTNNWQGKWSFRGRGFCTFYNDGTNGGCWQILKTSENCYEFYAMSRAGVPLATVPGRRRVWVARGWRASRGSTCDPEVGV